MSTPPLGCSMVNITFTFGGMRWRSGAALQIGRSLVSWNFWHNPFIPLWPWGRLSL